MISLHFAWTRLYCSCIHSHPFSYENTFFPILVLFHSHIERPCGAELLKARAPEGLRTGEYPNRTEDEYGYRR